MNKDIDIKNQKCECGRPVESFDVCYGLWAGIGHGTEEEIEEKNKLCGWSGEPKVSCNCLPEGGCRNYIKFYDGERVEAMN